MSRVVRIGLVACAVLAAALLALTLERVAERGRFARALSSYGSGPQGVRALYLLAAELGYRPVRWSQDLARLPARATLLALGDCESGMARLLSRYEGEELVRWLGDGGVLVVAGARHYLPHGLGIEFEPDPRCPAKPSPQQAEPDEAPESTPDAGAEADGGVSTPQPEAAPLAPLDAGTSPDAGAAARAEGPDDGAAPEPADQSAEPTLWGVPMARPLRGLSIVPFRDPSALSLANDPAVQTLMGAPDATDDAPASDVEPLVVTLQHGRGRLIVLASASMLQNAELESSEGAALFARLLGAYSPGDVVLFDEYHLGVGERRSLMQYLRQLGAMPALCQLLFGVVLALWRGGARFGAVHLPAPAAPAGTTSFVSALGRLYQRVGDSAAAVRLIARAALARIAGHHGIAAVQATALESALSERGAYQAQSAVQRIVAAVGSVRSESLIAIVQRIDAAEASALSGQREPRAPPAPTP